MGDSLSGIPPPPDGFTEEIPPPPAGFTDEIPPPPAGFTEDLTPATPQRADGFFSGLAQDWHRGVAQLQQNWAGTRASALQTLEQNQGLVEAYPGGPKVPILPDLADPTKAAPETQQAIQAGYQDVAGDLVRHQATITANPAPAVVGDIAKAGNDRDFMAAWTAFKEHPIDAIASTTVGSFPQMLAGLGVGAVTRNPALGAATMGLTSGAAEWGNAIVDALQDAAKAKNIPLTPETAAMLMQDPELMAAARQRGAIRGLIVGGFDALSGGTAGANLIPKQLVKGAVTREVANIVPQALSQGVMGGAGEALGELASTGQVKWGDALLEVIGEFGGAPAEVATMGHHQISERLNAASERRKAGQPAAPGDLDAVQAGLNALDTAIDRARQAGNEAAATRMQSARDQMAANFTGAADPTAAAGKVIDRTAQDELAAVQQRQNAGVDPSTMTEAQRRDAGITPGMPEADAIRAAMLYEAEQRAQRAEISGTMPAELPPLPPVIALPDRSLAAPGDQAPVNRGTPVGGSPGLAEGALLRGGGAGTALVPTQPQAQPMTAEEVAAAQQQTRQADREQAARGQEPQADTSAIDAQIGRIDKLLSGTNLDPASRTQLETQRERLAQTRADRLGIGRPMTGTAEGQARSAGQQEMVQQAETMQAADRTKADQAFALAQRQRLRTLDETQLNDIADTEGHPDQASAALELRARMRADQPATRAGMDTQAAGAGAGPQRDQVFTHVQDGVEYPVKVMGRDAQGRVLVQRYDPRTGDVEPGSQPYVIKETDLNSRTYTQQPRQAQDVTQRAQVGQVTTGRAAGQRIDTVQGLPAQTYRLTGADPNQQFPGAQAERDTGRSPIPEQPARPENTRFWSREEQFMRDYAAREEQRRQRDEEAQRQRRERGQSEEQPKPKGKKGERSTNEARAVDGAFPVDADGHVVSTGGGPIIFGTQLQAAKWILNVGHKESTRQIFQIANHPTTNGTFSVQETGLSEEPSASPGTDTGPEADTGGGTGGGPTPPGSPPQIGGPGRAAPPSPPTSGPSPTGTGGPTGPTAPSGSGTGPGASPGGSGGAPGGPTASQAQAQAAPEAAPVEPTSAAPEAGAPPPSKREQAAQGKAAQATSVEAIRTAARDSPTGQWMSDFEARIAVDNPALSAAIKRAPAALRPFLMRAAYAGVAAFDAAGGVKEANAARIEAVRQVVAAAVAAMRGDGNARAGDHAISTQFKDDLTHAYNSGERIAGEMVDDGNPIPDKMQIEATTRTARGQETNYKFGSAQNAEQTAERLSKQGGATFYSFPGMLFDPKLWGDMAKGLGHVGKMLRGAVGDWTPFGESMTALGTTLGSMIKGAAKGPAHVAAKGLQAMEQTVGVGIRSAGGALRAVARARDSATILKLANDLDAPSRGMFGGQGVSRAFNEAFRIKRNEVGKQVTEISKRLTELVNSAPRLPDESKRERRLRVEEQLAKLVRNPGARRGALGELATDVAKMLKDLRQYAVDAGVKIGDVGPGYLPRMFNPDPIANDHKTFLDIATAAYRRQGVPKADAEMYAQELLNNVHKGGFGIPGHSGAFAGAPASVKARTFDKQAEKAFQDAGFYVNDMEHMLLVYRDQIIRRSEIARRWGDGWSNWQKEVIAPLQQEKGNNDSWLANFAADYAEMITGVKPSAGARDMQNAVSWARALTGFSVLGNVTLTSLLEATAVTGRTGRIDEGVRSVLGSMVEAAREIAHLEPSERRRAAEELGLLAGDVLASANAGRFGAADGTKVEIARKEGRFYRSVGLEQITNGQYISVAQSGMRMLDRAATALTTGAALMSAERGTSMLGELGIPADQAKAFAKEWQRMRRDNTGANNKQPTAADYASPLGQMAQTALYRFVTQIIQTPDAGSKPRWASTTTGSLIFNLNSFAWAFARNMTIANVKLAKQAITGEGTGSGLKGLADRAAYLAPTIIGTGALMMASLLTIGIKDKLDGTDDEDIARRTDGWWWENVARRSGLLMAADPVLQAAGAALYGREPVTSLIGPTGGLYAEELSSLAQYFIKNTDKSNAAERRLARATWDAVIAPSMVYMILAARIPGLAGAAATVATTHKATRKAATDAMAGEEDFKAKSRRQLKPSQGFIEQMLPGG